MAYTKEEINLIVVNSFRKLSNKHKKYFLAAQKQTGENKYADELIKNIGVGVYNKLREKFFDEEYRKNLLSLLDKKQVECVTFKSADFPEGLKHVSDPPLVLYLRGNRKLLGESVFGVTGARKSTVQALEECKKICERLSRRLVIATGVACGAENAAVAGALPSGRIICVLPCGHGSSSGVLREVEERGLSISEFPPETRFGKYSFSLRNRIFAGLCSGVLVVSAGMKSGTFSIVNYALEYGKDVFAFPYNLGVESGAGCNYLIKCGANLCDCADDIFSAMGVGTDSDGKKEVSSELTDDEKAVLNALKTEGELHAEKLAAMLGKKPYELSVICSSLEIKGLLVRTGGNKFAAL